MPGARAVSQVGGEGPLRASSPTSASRRRRSGSPVEASPLESPSSPLHAVTSEDDGEQTPHDPPHRARSVDPLRGGPERIRTRCRRREYRPPMAVVAVANQKGGVGKTTVTLGIADAAARRGLARPRGRPRSPGQRHQWPRGRRSRPHRGRRPGRRPHRRHGRRVTASGWPNGAGPVPAVAPSSPALAAREPQLATDPIGAQDRLRHALDGVTSGYDLVLVDCPPSLGLLTVNGLVAADRVLIVTEPAAWASDGVEQMLRTVEPRPRAPPSRPRGRRRGRQPPRAAPATPPTGRASWRSSSAPWPPGPSASGRRWPRRPPSPCPWPSWAPGPARPRPATSSTASSNVCWEVPDGRL